MAVASKAAPALGGLSFEAALQPQISEISLDSCCALRSACSGNDGEGGSKA